MKVLQNPFHKPSLNVWDKRYSSSLSNLLINPFVGTQTTFHPKQIKKNGKKISNPFLRKHLLVNSQSKQNQFQGRFKDDERVRVCEKPAFFNQSIGEVLGCSKNNDKDKPIQLCLIETDHHQRGQSHLHQQTSPRFTSFKNISSPCRRKSIVPFDKISCGNGNLELQRKKSHKLNHQPVRDSERKKQRVQYKEEHPGEVLIQGKRFYQAEVRVLKRL